MSDTKRELLNSVIHNIEKQYGKGSIMILGDAPEVDIPVIPSGAMSLDIALGVGGYPRGRIIEIYGPESSGKTTLALHAIAEAQKKGGLCAFVDVEHAFDPSYAKRVGVQVDNLVMSQPDYAEQALEIVESLVRSNAIDVVVVDSVAALVPRSEIEGEMGDSHMGVQARLMSQALRKLTAAVSKSSTCLIFINQLRMKIGVMFGNPETTTGGNALKFYASVRLDVRKIASIKEKEDIKGNQVKVKVVKNKVSPPFKEAVFDMMYGKGIDRLSDLVNVAERAEIIKKSGSWYSYEETRLGQGVTNVCNTLKENTELTKEIADKVKAFYNLVKEEEITEVAEEKKKEKKEKK